MLLQQEDVARMYVCVYLYALMYMHIHIFVCIYKSFPVRIFRVMELSWKYIQWHLALSLYKILNTTVNLLVQFESTDILLS